MANNVLDKMVKTQLQQTDKYYKINTDRLPNLLEKD